MSQPDRKTGATQGWLLVEADSGLSPNPIMPSIDGLMRLMSREPGKSVQFEIAAKQGSYVRATKTHSALSGVLCG